MSASAFALSMRSAGTRRPARCRRSPCPAARRNALRERSAQRSDRRMARSTSASVHGSFTHSSNCIWMSEPSRSWISIERSGVRIWRDPSMCDWKVTPFSSSLRSLRERHDLEAAGIGEDRIGPVHELVQPAERRDALGARAQHQMIDIAEHDVGAQRLHLLGVHRLDRRRRADRHEGGRADRPARHRDHAQPRGAVRFLDGEGKVLIHGRGPFADAASERRHASP